METLNEKPCQYCGENFTPKRITKKYCSDNCRQMDYFKRNGFTQSGNIENDEQKENFNAENTNPVNTVKEEIAEEVKEVSLYGNSNEDENEEESEEQEGKEEKNTGSHLHLVTNEEEEQEEEEKETKEDKTNEIPIVKEVIVKDTNATNEKETALNVKPDNSFSEATTVKDDKQIIPTVKSITENPETNRIEQKTETVKQESKSFCEPSEKINVKSSSLTQNTTDTVKQELNVKDCSKQSEKKYQYVNSKFFDWINQHIDKNWYYTCFINPDERWGLEYLQRIKWVSPRIRCLFESLLKLGNCLFIDRQSLLAITDAFVRLTESKEFKGLPNNFPYINPVKELKDKLLALLSEVKGQDKIRFRLSPRKKAFIMAMRFEMAPYVPSMKFSQLTFGDELLLSDDDDEKDEEKEKNKESSDKNESTGFTGSYFRRRRRKFYRKDTTGKS
jgi:chemotaxis protein histidine kinase CheA